MNKFSQRAVFEQKQKALKYFYHIFKYAFTIFAGKILIANQEGDTSTRDRI